MLATGALHPDDWTGDLGESLRQGLQRWVDSIEREHQVLDLSLSYTDDFYRVYGADGSVCSSTDLARQEGPVGVLALQAGDYTQVTVGHKVLGLERAYRGLGYQVLRVLDLALWRSVRCASPSWAEEQVRCNLENYGSPQEARAEGLLSMTRFHQSVPPGACGSKLDRERLRRGLGRNLLEEQRQMVETALALLPWLDADEDDVGDQMWTLDDNGEPVLPVGLRWSEHDFMGALIDDYHNMIAQGSETYLVWARWFSLDHPETLTECVGALRQVLEALALCDRLLGLLDSTIPAEVASETLVEVLAQERVRV
ncbi:MAG TPA: hypothetical protein VGN26_04750 [Armatimonadota bacterium]|jgi:PRTRC genetic system protein F